MAPVLKFPSRASVSVAGPAVMRLRATDRHGAGRLRLFGRGRQANLEALGNEFRFARSGEMLPCARPNAEEPDAKGTLNNNIYSRNGAC